MAKESTEDTVHSQLLCIPHDWMTEIESHMDSHQKTIINELCQVRKQLLRRSFILYTKYTKSKEDNYYQVDLTRSD